MRRMVATAQCHADPAQFFRRQGDLDAIIALPDMSPLFVIGAVMVLVGLLFVELQEEASQGLGGRCARRTLCFL